MFYEGKKGNLKVRGEGRADFTAMGELMLYKWTFLHHANSLVDREPLFVAKLTDK